MPEPSRFPPTAFSAAEDAKGKVQVLSEEAQQEIAKASAVARAKAGEIPLFSGKYYAACTFGGQMACVGISITNCSNG